MKTTVCWHVIQCSLVDYQVSEECAAMWHTLNTEPAQSSKMSVMISQIAWCHITEDSDLHNHCYETLKYCIVVTLPAIMMLRHSTNKQCLTRLSMLLLQ